MNPAFENKPPEDEGNDEKLATKFGGLLDERRNDLWREYELVQRKIDSSATFRMVIVGWSMAAASVAPILVLVSQVGWETAFLGLLMIFLLLLVVHKLAMDQLATGLKLGDHAKNLERELGSIDQVRRDLALKTTSEAVGTRLREIAAETVKAEGSHSARQARRKRREPSAFIVDQAIKKLETKTPSVALVATSGRLTWWEYIFMHAPTPKPPPGLAVGISSRLRLRELNPEGDSKRIARQQEAMRRAERREQLLDNLEANRWVLIVQTTSLALGFVVSLFSKSPAENAKADEATAKSTPKTEEADVPPPSRGHDIVIETKAEVPLVDSNNDEMTGGVEEQPAVNDWMHLEGVKS